MSEQVSREERNKFDMYVFEMEDVLDQFVDDAEQAGFDLDYSLHSLDSLEAYWLAHKGDPNAEQLMQRSVSGNRRIFSFAAAHAVLPIVRVSELHHS